MITTVDIYKPWEEVYAKALIALGQYKEYTYICIYIYIYINIYTYIYIYIYIYMYS
jgi:hypothetical protein